MKFLVPVLFAVIPVVLSSHRESPRSYESSASDDSRGREVHPEHGYPKTTMISKGVKTLYHYTISHSPPPPVQDEDHMPPETSGPEKQPEMSPGQEDRRMDSRLETDYDTREPERDYEEGRWVPEHEAAISPDYGPTTDAHFEPKHIEAHSGYRHEHEHVRQENPERFAEAEVLREHPEHTEDEVKPRLSKQKYKRKHGKKYRGGHSDSDHEEKHSGYDVGEREVSNPERRRESIPERQRESFPERQRELISERRREPIPERRRESFPERQREPIPERQRESIPERRRESIPERQRESIPERRRESIPERRRESREYDYENREEDTHEIVETSALMDQMNYDALRRQDIDDHFMFSTISPISTLYLTTKFPRNKRKRNRDGPARRKAQQSRKAEKQKQKNYFPEEDISIEQFFELPKPEPKFDDSIWSKPVRVAKPSRPKNVEEERRKISEPRKAVENKPSPKRSRKFPMPDSEELFTSPLMPISMKQPEQPEDAERRHMTKKPLRKAHVSHPLPLPETRHRKIPSTSVFQESLGPHFSPHLSFSERIMEDNFRNFGKTRTSSLFSTQPKSHREQFHEQGTEGQSSYKFGYTTGDQENPMERYEERDADGYVRGRYSYIDANGKQQTVHYESHPDHGFRTVGSHGSHAGF